MGLASAIRSCGSENTGPREWIWAALGEKSFLTGPLFSSQAWADAFRSSPDLTGVVHIYEELKRKGVEFPMADLDALSPIHTPQRVSFQLAFF